MIQVQDYIDCHGIPILVPPHHNPEEVEETESEPVYQPAATCGQCEHFYQGNVTRAKGGPWGYCPVKDVERCMSAKPCRLYEEDCPF